MSTGHTTPHPAKPRIAKTMGKARIFSEAMPFIKDRYGFEGKGCGLCQTMVPCESRIPIRYDKAE